MDTPAIADFPNELDRLAEWQRRRATEGECVRDSSVLPPQIETETDGPRFRNAKGEPPPSSTRNFGHYAKESRAGA